jgi:hypothetical protein
MRESQGLINPHRLRQIPRHYSWLDHRLIHEGYLRKISAEASTLYLFLVCVGDHQGLSYYSDGAIKKRLSIGDISLSRQELIGVDLIAYSKPFYQVLSLPEKSKTVAASDRVGPPPEFYAYRDSLK